MEDPDKNPKAIDNWITNIVKLHREKPPQNVHYTKPMPDVEKLMQEWPPEFEELLNTINLPSADLECELTEYIDIVCGNNLKLVEKLFTKYFNYTSIVQFARFFL